MPFDSRDTIRCLRLISAAKSMPDVVGDDAVLLAVLQVLVEVRGVEERLGRDAAAQESRSRRCRWGRARRRRP